MDEMKPPIPYYAEQTGEREWVNLISGDIVGWSEQYQTYLIWMKDTGAWQAWGPSGRGTMCWHPLAPATNPTPPPRGWWADFWFGAMVGFFIYAGMGFDPMGRAIMIFFASWGAIMSLMHLKSPAAYDVVAAIGLISLAGTIHGHNETSRQNPIPHDNPWQ